MTGSTAGIGAEIARRLEESGWRVVRHARSHERAAGCQAVVGDRAVVLVGDLASLEATRALAEDAASLAPFDAVVHNAGWAGRDDRRVVTVDGLEQTFAVNAVAPYLLTCRVPVPPRLVYVSSDSIRGAVLDLDDLQQERGYDPGRAYAASKVAVTALALLVARRRPDVVSTAVHPGWVRTAMSDDRAPLDVGAGADTAVWLADSDDPAAARSGRMLHERRPVRYCEQAHDPGVQDALVAALEQLTGEQLPTLGQ